MDQKIYDILEANPVIAAVKNIEDLEKCAASTDIKVVFILYGDICSIPDIVATVKDAGQMAVVHIDLIAGLGAKEIAADYIRTNTQADGIISTKPSLVRRAKELGMFTVLRYFLIDSMALENISVQQSSVKPDVIEVLPGLMPDVIRSICRYSRVPVIAGGLIRDKKSVLDALAAGAVCVSSTNHNVWKM